MALGIGIDTGGTYTDAVIYDFDRKAVLAAGKALTTRENLETGIMEALDSLPGELLRKASLLSLSTTLATNACVENKGGRARLILLGTSDKILELVDAPRVYGLQPEDVLCIPEADWQERLLRQEDFLSEAQALAVGELAAMRNGSVYEKEARDLLAPRYPVPIVTAGELAAGLNIMERGATALLNARLLPIVKEFMVAVASALEKRGLSVREMIVRSDGSLMSRASALTYPVQTILSGPASSVMGAGSLARCEDCLIVDMGGTTTDISIVRKGRPVMSDRTSIGGYRTQIKGVYIDTIGLGGDSRILAERETLTLSPRRVQPLCVAAREHPQILRDLEELVARKRKHTMPLHEFLYLVREPSARYNAQEQALIAALRQGPVMLGSGTLDIYNLNTERLEQEGVVMRCGLTPTDMMHIRGDFSLYDSTASRLGAQALMYSLPDFRDASVEDFAEAVYDLVCRKLYESVLRILLLNSYPHLFSRGLEPQLEELIRQSWFEKKEEPQFFGLRFRTRASLVGIGAPTHIFLPRVAEALGTPCVIPEFAHVANAVGAITSRVSAFAEVRVKPIYSVEDLDTYAVYSQAGEQLFGTREEALDYAREQALLEAAREARSRGALGELETDVHIAANIVHARYGGAIELDTYVQATARGSAGI